METNASMIRQYYKYVKPKQVDTLGNGYDDIVEDEEAFVNIVIEANKNFNTYTSYRRWSRSRKTENITFLNSFFVDIDDDLDEKKSKKFEIFCKLNNITVGTKAMSGGGYQYLIPYKDTEITDDNREKYRQINSNFITYLQNNGIDVDNQCKDLPRLIRVWGTWNYRRGKMCELLHINNLSREQLDHNTKFIDNIPEQHEKTVLSDSTVNTCEICELAAQCPFGKTDTGFNHSLGKNVAAYFREKEGEAGREKVRKAYKLQGHNEAEADGWFKKTDIKPVCAEIQKYIRGFYPEKYREICIKCKRENKNSIIYVNDETMTFKELKDKYRDQSKLPINKQHFIKGMVGVYSQNKISFVVGKMYVNHETQEKVFYYFDENFPPKSGKLRHFYDVYADFYIYTLNERNVEFLLLSEKELTYGEYYIDGSLLYFDDRTLVGESGTKETKRKVILCHTAQPLIAKIKNHKQLFEMWNYNEDEFYDYLFSHVKEDKVNPILSDRYILIQPPFIKTLMSSFLFSSKYEGYPLHLIIIGPRHAGKSAIITCAYTKFNEYQEIIDLGTSRFKGLIPSYFGKTVSPGVFIKAIRIAFLEEKFNIVKKNIAEEGEDLFNAANNIIEHKANVGSVSGKGSTKAQMRAKILAVSNPIHGESFLSSMTVMPAAYISRYLVINLPKLYIDWVNSNLYKKEGGFDIDKNLFLSVYDYLNSFRSEFDRDKLKKMVNEFETNVNKYMVDIYKGRYVNHHALCVMDGIVKTRCLFKRDESFKAKDVDYKIFKEFWRLMIDAWVGDENEEDKERYINEDQRYVLNILKNEGDKYDYQLEKMLSKCNIDFKATIKRLIQLKLISLDNRLYSYIHKDKTLTLDDIERLGDDVHNN